MIENTFDENQLIIKEKDDILNDIVHFKISYLKEFNIISNDEEEKIFLSEGINFFKKKYLEEYNQNEQKGEIEYNNTFIKNNYNIEKYFLQFYNFNNNYIKELPCENIIELFKIFKDITEKIKNTKFIEILFRDKNDLLKKIYEKINFENIAKAVKKEEEVNNIKEKINELKQIKEVNFKSFFDCLLKFYAYIV